MNEYQILTDNTFKSWSVFGTDDNAKPSGAALGTYESFEQATDAVKALRGELAAGIDIAAYSPVRGGFKLIKNDTKWVAWYSNAMKDREGEIFPMAETDRFIKMIKDDKWPMPELWRKHMAGSKHGQATWIGRIGLITLAMGDFDNTPIAQKWITYYRDHEQELSHGFLYVASKKQNGVYGPYATFEITTLDPGEAANQYTIFGVKDMPITEQDLKALIAQVGEADAQAIVSGTTSASKKFVDMGVAYKALTGKDPLEPDKDDADKPKDNKKSADLTVDSKAITDLEAAVKAGFADFTKMMAAVIKPMSDTIATQQKQLAALATSHKGLLDLLQREFSMQPPATGAQSTQGAPPADPNLAQYMQGLYGQPQGTKEQNMPYGPFGEIFAAMGGNKSAQPTGFEVPGVQPMPQAPMQQPQQGFQFPQIQQPMQQQPMQQQIPTPTQQQPTFFDQFGIAQQPPTSMGAGFPRFPTNNGQ